MLWKDRYNLGDELIDSQHRELFKRVSDFLEVLRSSESWNERVYKVNETLNFMKAYVVSHFNDEEKYQRELGYPNYEQHKKTHEAMVSYVAQVSEQLEKEGFDEKLVQQFAGKLLAWLIHHVASEDQKIAEYAKTKGVAVNE